MGIFAEHRLLGNCCVSSEQHTAAFGLWNVPEKDMLHCWVTRRDFTSLRKLSQALVNGIGSGQLCQLTHEHGGIAG